MKKYINLYLMIALIACCSACGSEDEVPPRIENIESDFQLPRPTTLTPEDREVIRILQTEYEKAMAEAEKTEDSSTESNVQP